MKIFHVDSSPKGAKSGSRMLARDFLSMLEDRAGPLDVDYLDLAQENLPHVTGAFAAAAYTPEDQRSDEMRAVLSRSDALCERLLAADMLLFAMPMYNWSMPSNFKAFIDMIVRGGLTYDMGSDGEVRGLLDTQKALFLTTRGAFTGPGSPYEGMDALTPALRSAFKFLGVSDPEFVNAEPMQFATPEMRDQAIGQAREELAAVADRWSRQCVAA